MKTDVLIVGSGCSALYMALHLPEDLNILMVTKKEAELSDSFLAQGGICMLRNEDDYDSYFEDTMKAGHYENDAYSVELMIKSSPDVIQDLISYGVDFERNEDGSLAFTREGAHSQKRILYHEDITGKEITRHLLEKVRQKKNVTLLEIMGRNAGWLTAAASLTRELGGSYAPQLIYLPEAVFDPEQFVEDVRRELDKRDTVVIAVSEGVRLADGSYAAESMQSGQVDAFGHKYLAGVGKYLERLTADRIGCKVRSLELSVMQRAAAHLQSAIDLEEAVRAGEKAVEAMLRGDTRIMIAYRRISDAPYRIAYETAPLGEVANVEHKIPREWINEAGNDVREELVRYLAPLIQGEVSVPMKNGVPMHFSFDKTRLAD